MPKGSGNGVLLAFWGGYLNLAGSSLPAEVILDAISQATGMPEKFPGYPSGTRALQFPDVKVNSYFITTFGRNPRDVTDEAERMSSPSITQVLHIMNGEALNRKLMAQGAAVDMLVKLGLSNGRILDNIFLSAFSRYPGKAERGAMLKALSEAESKNAGTVLRGGEAKREILEDLLWAVLTSKEFLFNH